MPPITMAKGAASPALMAMNCTMNMTLRVGPEDVMAVMTSPPARWLQPAVPS